MSHMRPHPVILATLALALGVWQGSETPAVAARYDGTLTLTTVDQQTGQPLAVRMELRDQRGRPVRVHDKGLLSRDGYVVFDGEATLRLRKGQYTFLIEAGPEYQTRPGHFSLERHAEDTKQITLLRRVNMREEGWWAADLDVSLSADDLPLLTRAAAVDFVPRLTEQNIKGKCKSEPGRLSLPAVVGPRTPTTNPITTTLDHRQGGPLLYLNPSVPLNICQWKANDTSLASLSAAHEAGATTIAATPFAWDLPLWIASGKLDAIATLHRHSLHNGVVDNEGWGRPRDKAFFPGKLGNGRYSESIYHHVLNCGLRIPPVALSGAGANGNPVGTNRVYAYCGEDFSPQQWIKSLRAGQVMVTNGPLLRASVSGQQPGHVFQLERGEKCEFQIALSLTFYEQSPVEYLEIVKNGHVLHELRLDELAERQGRPPPVPFEASGWFLVRARTSSPATYQYASTGPFYVEANYQHRISRRSVQYFLDWLTDAQEKFANSPTVIADIEAALPFWQDLLEQANVD